ncbi:MAG: hypothetical protein JO001_01035 [Alphaproteobacteria bacterium]|nr:hypothetical protein [Alphaproteobacteria bacterium]
MDQTFADFLTTERNRLNSERQRLIEERNSIDNKIAELDRERLAIDAYTSAKAGAPARTGRAAVGRTGEPRARKGSKRGEIIALIRAADGLSRGDILDRMGLRGDKAGEMSVSNALTALVKAGEVKRQDGHYRYAA